MTSKITKNAYENPDVVDGYVNTHALNPKLFEIIEKFSKTIKGKKVLDLGCGPGHDSYKFAELGFEVVGLDYSSEMIKRAELLKDIENDPEFVVGDMREIADLFQENEFDAAWVSASILHVDEKDVPKVLEGLRKVLKQEAVCYIGVKGGKQGAVIVEEEKYGNKMQREFIFWERSNFEKLLKNFDFEITEVTETQQGKTGDYPTNWINFFVVNHK